MPLGRLGGQPVRLDADGDPDSHGSGDENAEGKTRKAWTVPAFSARESQAQGQSGVGSSGNEFSSNLARSQLAPFPFSPQFHYHPGVVLPGT